MKKYPCDEARSARQELAFTRIAAGSNFAPPTQASVYSWSKHKNKDKSKEESFHFFNMPAVPGVDLTATIELLTENLSDLKKRNELVIFEDNSSNERTSKLFFEKRRLKLRTTPRYI